MFRMLRSLSLAALLGGPFFHAHVQASPEDSVARTTTRIPQERLEAVARFVESSRGRLGLPGVAVSVASGDSVLWAGGYGDRRPGRSPIDQHTPFPIGSVTKTLTATAIAQLSRDGALDLDAPLETYLRDFSMRAPFEPRSVTLRQLLQHRSGFSQWSGHDRRAQTSGRFGHLSPSRPPGVRAEYSSLNYIVLGRIAEEASGRPYGRLLEESLFEPLGMADAFVPGAHATPVQVPIGHQSYFGLQLPRREPPAPRFLVPAGFVSASAHDLGRFGGMLVGGGVLAGERILDARTVEALLGPIDSTGRAMAWGRWRERGTLLLEHAGNARTASARVRLVPERGYAIAVLSNTNSGPFFPATADLMNGIHAILEGERAPAVWPRERLFKGALLVGTALSIGQLVRRTRAWNRAGRPTHLEGSARTLGPLAVDIVGGSALLFGIPRYFGVPLQTMTEYFPDLGIALVTSVGAGVVGGVLQAWTRSGN